MDQETKDLISFYETLSIPVEAIRLNDHTTITDQEKFIKSHIDTVKANAHNPLYGVYKERLRQMRDLSKLG